MVVRNTKKTPRESASVATSNKGANPKSRKPHPVKNPRQSSNDKETFNAARFPQKGEGEGDDADWKTIKLKLKIQPFCTRSGTSWRIVTIRVPDSDATPKLHEVVGNGKGPLSLKNTLLIRLRVPSSQPDDDTSEKVSMNRHLTSVIQKELKVITEYGALKEKSKARDEADSYYLILVIRQVTSTPPCDYSLHSKRHSSEPSLWSLLTKSTYEATTITHLSHEISPTFIDLQLRRTKLDDALLRFLQRLTADLNREIICVAWPRVLSRIRNLKDSEGVFIADERRWIRKLQTKVKTTTRNMLVDDDEDDDDDEGLQMDSNQDDDKVHRSKGVDASGPKQTPIFTSTGCRSLTKRQLVLTLRCTDLIPNQNTLNNLQMTYQSRMKENDSDMEDTDNAHITLRVIKFCRNIMKPLPLGGPQVTKSEEFALYHIKLKAARVTSTSGLEFLVYFVMFSDRSTANSTAKKADEANELQKFCDGTLERDMENKADQMVKVFHMFVVQLRAWRPGSGRRMTREEAKHCIQLSRKKDYCQGRQKPESIHYAAESLKMIAMWGGVGMNVNVSWTHIKTLSFDFSLLTLVDIEKGGSHAPASIINQKALLSPRAKRSSVISLGHNNPIILSFHTLWKQVHLKSPTHILVIFCQKSEVLKRIVFTMEDGNPARANIKQALVKEFDGYRKDGDGDGNSQFLRCQVNNLMLRHDLHLL
ncbi:hypothetical protein Tco_0804006 [Tanacetum coccineum]|uniref:Uncharacterized protein n=1 Tax=Tanacetum coccineum TaxID=301880 RepID=A0ABQ5A7M2_9ASTR